MVSEVTTRYVCADRDRALQSEIWGQRLVVSALLFIAGITYMVYE